MDAAEIKIRKVNNGWILDIKGDDGDESEVYEVYPVDDSVPKSEKQHEQECLAFAQALRSINNRVGPGTIEDSPHSVKVEMQTLKLADPVAKEARDDDEIPY